MKPQQIPIAIISSFILLEILSIATSDSYLPWAVLSNEKMVLKVLGWVCAVQAILGLFMLLIIKMLRDKNCTICEKNLTVFMPVYGSPIMCPMCKSFFHKNCFKSKNNKCPICNKCEADDILYDFTSPRD